MGARNREGNALKFYALKAKVDKENDPFFAVSEKVDGKWQNTEQYSEVFGRLTKAELTTREFEGVVSDQYNITLSDENENSVIQMTNNQITYGIINSLCSLEDFDGELSIRVYKTEDKSEDNAKTYYNGRSYVTLNGERVDWAFDPKTLPKPEQLFKANGDPVLQNGKKVFDHEGVHKFWNEKFNQLIENLKEKPSKEEEKPVKETNKPKSTSEPEDEDHELPF